MSNFLETLVAEWFEFSGYFVRRNVLVGPRPNGGHDCELDVVAYHPGKRRLVHVEPSMDSNSWAKREERYAKKFEAGRRHIPRLFAGMDLPEDIEQVALLVYGSTANRRTIGGGRIVPMVEFMAEIRIALSGRAIEHAAVPEVFPTIRALQFAAHYWNVAPIVPSASTVPVGAPVT
ncbi:hypothetical protein [Azospirillum soli]|uniref:hypothetical protein n=1 Tax=Azospirillum soli TaxID=1304799 RepID=UPI001AE734BB|nr:hypothetical protein [Azospirillum soli]MBP2311487.1 hypothetical protein [Azospirillum soli]